MGGRSAARALAAGGATHRAQEHATIFRFVCDRPALELRSIWRAHPGPGPVEHTILITNREAQEILLPLQPTLAFSFAAAPGHTIEQWWVERGGSRPSDVGTHRDRIGPGLRSSLVSTPYGGGPIPWLSVQDVEGRRGWYAGIEFSGFVRMALQAGRAEAGEACTVRTVLGLGKSDAEDLSYRTRLAAGATFETPTVFLGCYGGHVDDGANRLRRWVERHLRPPCKANLPLLVNNSWGDGMAVDEAMMRRMIDLCARLGMEMAGVDAGWFRHVGDWRTDPRKFPSGLAPVADYAHGKGLLFGLWLAWTQGGDRTDAARPGKCSARAIRPCRPGSPPITRRLGRTRISPGQPFAWASRRRPRGVWATCAARSRSSRWTCWNTTR